MNFHKLFAAISAVVVAVAVIGGLVIVGSPFRARKERFDERRVEDLRAIYNEIMNMVHEGRPREFPAPTELREPLPRTLDDVAARAVKRRVNTADPETGQPYEYHILDATHFELCASFSFERRAERDVFWDHPAGRHCYTLDALAVGGPTKPAGQEKSPRR